MSTEPISIAELIREADERLTASRLGKSIARETDRDLLTIRHLRNALMVAATRQPDRAVEVRALPDREKAALALGERLLTWAAGGSPDSLEDIEEEAHWALGDLLAEGTT